MGRFWGRMPGAQPGPGGAGFGMVIGPWPLVRFDGAALCGVLRDQVFQSLLHADGTALGIGPRESQYGIAVALEYKQGGDSGSEVLDQCAFEAENRAHAGIRTADRLVIDGEAVLDPGHVSRLAIHTRSL